MLPCTATTLTVGFSFFFAYLSASVLCRVSPPVKYHLPSLQTLLGSYDASSSTLDARRDLLYALKVMQDEYFDLSSGIWPTSIDWTSAVAGSHISASLSALLSVPNKPEVACAEELELDNILNKYFSHTSAYFYNEDAFALRNEAYDDMLWVVLGWLESIKFTSLRSNSFPANASWHGTQFNPLAAHRARIFYDLASEGWDTSLCSGGMNWNPRLRPYKNAITNELFIAASVAMYLYFPGDDNDSPYLDMKAKYPAHYPEHLLHAINAYSWLRNSNMTLSNGLYADGFHVTGWRRLENGTVVPGTEKCDDLNEMVYTYNQGVILSGLRGLYIASGDEAYLRDAHRLVRDVIRATNWPITNKENSCWAGLGRSGILEDHCDHRGQCSQDAQTFKGIFFGHLAEFCRPLHDLEESSLSKNIKKGLDDTAYLSHLEHCKNYGDWVRHNARAALLTRDKRGRFGMWWGAHGTPPYHQIEEHLDLRAEEVNYRNWARKAVLDGEENEYGKYVPQERYEAMGKSNDINDRERNEKRNDVNDRGRGRTVETQMGGLGVLRAAWMWESLLAN